MIVRGLGLCAALLLALPVHAQTAFEVDQYDFTGDLPDGFGPPDSSENANGARYRSLDGAAELLVFGGDDVFDGVAVALEITKSSAEERGDTILMSNHDEDSFLIVARLRNGGVYFRYTLSGQTCESVPVFGTVVLSYREDQAAIYEPMIGPLVTSLFIGACG